MTDSVAEVAAQVPRGVEELALLTEISTRLMGQAKTHAISGNCGFWDGSHCQTWHPPQSVEQ
jgi:hypothetical protein